jgi:hypothetical protein
LNRWRTWAERLRARHRRRDGGRQAGALVFARGGRVIAHNTRIVSQALLQVRPRLSVTMRVIAPAVDLAYRPLLAPPRATTVVHSRMGDRVPHASWPRSFEPSVATPAAADPALRFIDARYTHASIAQGARRIQRLHEMVDRWRRKPVAAIEASALPGRIRGRGARAEMPVPELAAAVPVLHRRRPEGSPSPEWMPAGRGEPSRTIAGSAVPVPASAAIDVDALTSQVIHQLDRRLLAYRERMGRS